MPQQTYLQIFRERWTAIVAGFVAGIVVALVFCIAIPPSYTATATSFLTVRSSAATLTDGSQFALARIASYPALAVSSDVLGATIKQLGLDESVQQLADNVSATNPATTVLVQVSATARTAKEAALIANTVSTNLASTVSSLENTGSQNRYKVTLELRDRAQVPTSPSAPQKSIIIGLGALGGIAAGLVAALLWGTFDTTVRRPEDARYASGLPVIGELPSRTGRRLTSAAKRRLHLEHSLREALVTIRQSNGGALPRFLMVVPGDASAAEAWVRATLARAFADTGREVVLVESDFDGDTAKLLPDAAVARGLAEGLADPDDVLRLVRKPSEERFSLLPAGNADRLPPEFVAEQNTPVLLSALAGSFDLVISQVTSTTRPASLELFAPYTDGVVVVARWGRTRRSDLAHSLSRLRLAGIRPLGILLAGVPENRVTDLSANWRPEDFADEPRVPLHSLTDGSTEDDGRTEVPTASRATAPIHVASAPPQPARRSPAEPTDDAPAPRSPKRAPRTRRAQAPVVESAPDEAEPDDVEPDEPDAAVVGDTAGSQEELVSDGPLER